MDDSFLGRVALKLVVTTLFCVKLVINLWRFAHRESYCKKRPVSVYIVRGYRLYPVTKIGLAKIIGKSTHIVDPLLLSLVVIW